MPKEEKIAELYPPIYSFRPDFEGGGTFKQLVTAVEKRVFYNLMNCREVESVKRVSGIHSGTMLDVGCGTGTRLSRYAAAGFQVRGLEIQPELVQYIRQKLGFEADCGTLATVAYEPESFDIVTAHWVIEHLTDVHWALKKIYKMLKPGGWLVAEVPLADSWQGQVLKRRWSQISEAPRHVGIPSKEGMRQALKMAGFMEPSMLPSAILNCAGAFGLSVVPSSSTTHTHGSGGKLKWLRHLPRAAGGAVTLLYLPAAAIENFILKRPAFGICFSKKPA